jgi:hypothetical protein
VTLTATWLLPIAIIPGTWQVYEIPTTPQIIAGQMPSQPEPSETDNAVSAETQKEGGPVEGTVLDQGAQNPRPLLRRNLTRWRLGGHRHPHTRQNTSRHRDIGIPTLPSCGSLQNMDTLIRCIPAPALFITRSRITHLARILPQRRVTRHRCMDIISPWTLSRHPKGMNRWCTNLLRRRRL